MVSNKEEIRTGRVNLKPQKLRHNHKHKKIESNKKEIGKMEGKIIKEAKEKISLVKKPMHSNATEKKTTYFIHEL